MHRCSIFVAWATLFTFANFLMATCALGQDGSQIKLIGVGQISGTQIDRSDRNDATQDGTPNNQFGGISALEYSGQDNVFLALGDRGPKDGAVAWDCRFHWIKITWDEASNNVQTDIVRTIPLTDAENRMYPGDASAFTPSDTRSQRLDPEGIRLLQSGNLLISDEYGPRLLEFSADGRWVQGFEIPSRYLITRPGITKEEENENNSRGRQGNKGFEGLAVYDNDRSRLLVLQGPLLQDCEPSAKGKPVGKHVRMLKLDSGGGANQEFVYVLDEKKNVLNEILSLGNDEFLVIERDGEVGAAAQYKKIIKINIAQATDVSQIESLSGKLPSDIKPVQKTVLLDLLDPAFGLAGESMPEKIEGLALGPKTADGHPTLVIASDNDFEADIPSYFYVFQLGH